MARERLLVRRGSIAILFAWLAGPGCAFVSKDEYADRLDFDDDGHRDLAFGGDDCDDADPAVHPGASERCNGADDDCDGVIDPASSTDAIDWFSDADGDGWGSGASIRSCEARFLSAGQDGDCGPLDPTIHPEAPDTWYDGVDQDCAGDDDYDQDRDGWRIGEGDCDDTDDARNPGADETWYDGVDQDCAEDDDFDQDGDGFRQDQDDCDDTDAARSPAATETWYDDVDQDCAGDDDFDQDGDGYRQDEDDCDDTDAARSPAAQETCDAADVDEDCDGAADDDDDDATGGTETWADADGDGYGDPGTAASTCASTGTRVLVGRDCDDGDAAVNPSTGGCTNTLAASDAALTLYGASGDQLGASVCLGGDLDGDGAADLAVGGWGRDDDAAGGGAAWIVGASETGELDVADAWGLHGDEAGGGVGAALLCDDLDGDGADDLVVGAATDLVWVMAGPLATGVTLADAGATWASEADGDSAGYALDAGDLDGDGVAELVIGAPLASGEAGAAYVVPGDATGEAGLGAATLAINGATAGYLGGVAVAAIGDMDGDGVGEVAVGAPFSDHGEVWIFAGDRVGALTSADADVTYAGTDAGEITGYALADAGDTDGDGLAELLIGSPYANEPGLAFAGQAVLLGGTLSVLVDETWALATLTGDAYDQNAGTAVAAGDVDGDGTTDLIVGGSGGDGAAWVFLSPVVGTRPVTEAEARVDGAAGDHFGAVLSTADADADGRADLLVGSPSATTTAGASGAAWLFGATELLP